MPKARPVSLAREHPPPFLFENFPFSLPWGVHRTGIFSPLYYGVPTRFTKAGFPRLLGSFNASLLSIFSQHQPLSAPPYLHREKFYPSPFTMMMSAPLPLFAQSAVKILSSCKNLPPFLPPPPVFLLMIIHMSAGTDLFFPPAVSDATVLPFQPWIDGPFPDTVIGN